MRIKYLGRMSLGNSGAIGYIPDDMKPPSRLPRARLKEYQRLGQKKYRRNDSRFLVEGVMLVKEALDSDWSMEAVTVLSGAESQPRVRDILRQAEGRNIPAFEISARDLSMLSDTVTSQGIIGVVRRRKLDAESIWSSPQARALLVALEDIADPGNVGTILRTCDWYGADGVLVSSRTVDLFNPKVVRASMGSLFHLPAIECPDLSDALRRAKQNGFRVLAAVLRGGREPSAADAEGKSIVVLGNEAHGLSPGVAAMADARVTIPRHGRAESLNVAVACGVILAALSRGRAITPAGFSSSRDS